MVRSILLVLGKAQQRRNIGDADSHVLQRGLQRGTGATGATKTVSTSGDCAAFRPARVRVRRYQSLILSCFAPLMAEVAHVGEDHRNTVFVGGGAVTSSSRIEPQATDHAAHANGGSGINTIAEQEEGVRGHRGPFTSDLRQPL